MLIFRNTLLSQLSSHLTGQKDELLGAIILCAIIRSKLIIRLLLGLCLVFSGPSGKVRIPGQDDELLVGSHGSQIVQDRAIDLESILEREWTLQAHRATLYERLHIILET